MRIVATVHATHFAGGVELSVLHTTRELARRGHEIHLIYRETGELLSTYQTFCASMTQVGTIDFPFPENAFRAWREWQRVKPAIGLAAGRQPDVYYMSRTFTAVWAIEAARSWPAPIVCHWRGTATPPPKYVPRLSQGVTRFIANSGFTKDCWLATGIDPAKVDVVYAGVDASEYPQGGEAERRSARGILGLSPDAFVAIFVGRLDPEKGVEVLLEAWRIADLGPDATLLVVGAPVVSSNRDAYFAGLKARAPDTTVRFLGARRDVVTPLHSADVAVVPSTWDEPFGRVVVEALATGRPVIASRVGGIPEILDGPLARFLFERGDSAGLAAILREMRDWRRREPELAAACAQRAHERFSLSSMARGVEASLELAVKAARADGSHNP